ALVSWAAMLPGTFVYVNDEMLRMYNTTSDELIGTKLSEMGLPDELVEERMKLIRRVTDDGAECIVRSVWDGIQQFSWVRSVGGEAGEVPRVLAITRRIGTGEEADRLYESELPVLTSQFIALGELEKISKRELEVLVLIGQGMSTREIAAVLHRSPKTIENHRHSLGSKLNGANRIELAMIAREAGLTLEDSDRIRMGRGVGELV
ncbi:MAG: LuxR C-terminal-related transcriptional regulator, partial [Phycisphaerales bacterium]|nr:LuxR C-terminal-related transcriptional regulator [Phycisphaerales bacterium]